MSLSRRLRIYRPLLVLLATWGLGISAPAGALTSETSKGAQYAEDDDKPWAESKVKLPAFPVEDRLIRFSVGTNVSTFYGIDPDSLSIGEDGVVRYTLVIVSSGGARNVSYEGMRCNTAERRFYASGRPDGTWSEASSSQWVRIRGTSNNHYVELYMNYLCSTGGSSSAGVAEILKILRSGGLSPVHNR